MKLSFDLEKLDPWGGGNFRVEGIFLKKTSKSSTGRFEILKNQLNNCKERFNLTEIIIRQNIMAYRLRNP